MKCKISYRNINAIAIKYDELLNTDISADQIILKLGELISPDFLFDYDTLENVIDDFSDVIGLHVHSGATIKAPTMASIKMKEAIKNRKNFNKEVMTTLYNQVSKFVTDKYNASTDNIVSVESNPDIRGTIEIQSSINDIDTKMSLNASEIKDSIEEDYSEIIDYSTKLEGEGLKKYYKGAESVMLSLENEFKRSIIKASFINLKNGTITKNTYDLNKNINQYKNELFKNIIDYLNITDSSKVYSPIYNTGVPVNTDYYDSIIKIMPDVFKNISENTLLRKFNNKNNENDQKFINAYNSYVILNNFDEVLSDISKKFIKIDNTLYNVDKYDGDKYYLSIDNNLVKTWRTEENISAIDEIGSLPKMLVSIVPIKSIYGEYTGKYLTSNEFFQTFAKLKQENISILFDDNLPKKMRIRPEQYLKQSLEFILEPYNIENVFNNVFSRSELDIFNSVYETFFLNEDPKEGQDYSIYRTLVKEQNTHGPIYDMNILEVILNSISNIEKTTYMQYKRSFDSNDIELKNILENNTNTVKKSINIDTDIEFGTISPDTRSDFKTMFSTDIGDYTHDSFIKFTIPGMEGEFKYNINGSLLYNNKKILFNKLITNIDAEEFIEAQLNPRSEQEANLFKIYEFLDTLLGLKINRGNQNFIYNYMDVDKRGLNYIGELMIVGAKILWANELYIKADEEKIKIKDLMMKSNLYDNTFDKSKFKIFDSKGYIDVFFNEYKTLNTLAATYSLINNDLYKNNTLDLSGNSTPTTRITNLIKNASLQFELNRRSNYGEKSIMNNNAIYLNEGLLDDVVVLSDGQNRFKDNSKKSSQMNIGEIIYGSIVYDFLYNLQENGKFLNAPTTFSDKSSHYRLLMNANKEVIGVIDPFGNEISAKTLNEMNSFEINKVIYSSMHSMYNTIKNNLIEDYKIILSNYSDPKIREQDYSNLSWNNLKSIIPTLNTADIKHAARIARAKGNNVNIIEEVHYSNYKGEGLNVNKTIDYYIDLYSVDPSQTEFTKDSFSEKYKERIVRGKRKMIKNIFENHPNFYLTNLDGSPIKAFNTILNSDNDYKSKWIDQSTNSLILARYNGEPITKLNYDEILTDKNIRDTKANIEINPQLTKYYDMNQFTSILYTSMMVGPSYNHPAKGKLIPTEQEIIDGITREELEESARQLAQYKRMVIFPATLNTFIQNSINGVTQKYKIAVIEDVTAPVYNYVGKSDDQDVHDGSAWSNPVINKLENNSLLDQKVGEDVKSIGAFINPLFGNAGLLKWAVFSIYNERMRMSNGSNIKLKNMFKRMNDSKWDIPILNILEDFDGNTKTLSEKLRGERVFYKENGKFYEVLNMTSLGNNKYNVEKIRVDKKGVRIGESFNVENLIDTNYKLWETFGAENSMTLNNELEFSDSSIDNLTTIINSVGVYRTEENALKYNNDLGSLEYGDYYNSIDEIKNTIFDQTKIYQPMKHSMIAYLANKSSIKNGTANLNSSNTYYNNDMLDYFTIDTHNIGVQMDADHEANMSTVTEMSQVISAIEEKGRTHDISNRTYGGIKQMVYSSITDVIDALNKYYTLDDNTDYYKLIAKSLVKAIKNNNNSLGIAESIIEDISDSLMKSEITDTKVPFSDSSLLSLTISNLASSLNRSAIKRKYPGVASVLVPSYDMFQMYTLEHYDSTGHLKTERLMWNDIPELNYSDLVDLQNISLSDEELNLFTEEFNNKSWTQSILHDDGSFSNGSNVDKFDTLNDYIGYKIKEIQYLFSTTITGNKSEILDQISNLIELDKKYAYLHKLEENSPFISNEDIELQSNYNVYDINKNIIERNVVINTVDKYLKYRQHDGYFKKKISAENLKPSALTFEINGKKFNLFDLPSFQNVYSLSKDVDKQTKLLAIHEVQKQLDNLDKGFVEIPTLLIPNIINGNYELSLDGEVFTKSSDININDISNYKYVKVNNLNVSPAELILSKIYKSQFDLRTGDKIQTIKNSGPEFFYNRMLENSENKTNKYDLVFKRGNGNHVYVMFKSPETDIMKNKNVRVINEGENTFRSDELGNKLYDLNGLEIKSIGNNEIHVVDSVDALYRLYQSENFNYIEINNKTNKIDDIVNFINSKDADENILEIKTVYDKERSVFENNKDALNQTVNILNADKNNKLLKASNKKYSSFLKSLEFIAARIPSQSMQSFMPMVVTEFTDSEKNVAYVSHWQLWLQGSDYDIDKVYLMGYEFDRNGNYVGWNKLFDLNSYKNLVASENLPIPDGRVFELNYNKMDRSLDITEDLYKLIGDNNYPKNGRGKGINDLYKFSEFLNNIIDSDTVNLYYNPIELKENIDKKIDENTLNTILDNILNTINYQNTLDKDSSRIMSSGKNSISSKLFKIISHPRNQISAFSPVDMDEPREASITSEAGKEARTMNSDNPTSNSIMQFQNMSGKEVIGIAAVGLKTFFALSNYYNEQIKQNNFKNLIFDREFNLKGTNVKLNVLSNVYYNESHYEMLEKYANLIQNDNLTIEQAKQVLDQQLSPEQQDTSVVISALLSSATDNAKELILSKINAGSELAGMYIYLLMLGVDFQTISNFMKSPTLNIIAKLSKNSIFDETKYSNNVENVVKKLSSRFYEKNRNMSKNEKKLNIKKTKFNYDTFNIDDKYFSLGSEYKVIRFKGISEDVYNKIVRINRVFLEFRKKSEEYVPEDLDIQKENLFEERKIEMEYVTSMFYNMYVKNKNDINVQNFVNSLPNYKHKIMRMFEEQLYFDKQLSKVDKIDLEQFNAIYNFASEVKLLGSVLGINQGMKTNISGLFNYMQQIEQQLFKQEKEFKINKLEIMFQGINNVIENPSTIITNIIADKPYLKNIYNTVDDVDLYLKLESIISNSEDIMNGNFSFDRFVKDAEYRERVIEYYNLIKGTFNIFDVIDKVKHFNAMINVQNIGATSLSILSERYKYLMDTAKNIAKDSNFKSKDGYPVSLNERDMTTISDFFNEVMIVKWLENSDITFNLDSGNKVFFKDGNLSDSIEHPVKLKLNNESNIATFKYWFENYVYQNLKKGIVDQGIKDDIKSNRFIGDLTLSIKDDYIFGGSYPFLKTKLNMSYIESDFDKLRFDEYQTDFKTLNKYTVGGLVLTDAFFIYNLLMNKNKYGQGTISKIFQTTLNQEGTIIRDYFLKVGNFDWDKSLNEYDYNINDLLFKLAPDKAKLYEINGMYYKVMNYNEGKYDFFIKDKTPYNIDLKEGGRKYSKMNISDFYTQYFIIKNPSNSLNINVDSNLSESEFKDVIKRLIKNNQLKILIDCE